MELVKMYIPEHIAKMILEMENSLMGEGIGPDTDELMYWIYINYPQLFHAQWWAKLYIKDFNKIQSGDYDE
jgi:hypothetical protein